MDSGIHISTITKTDLDSLFKMIGELADDQGERQHLTVTRQRLETSGLGDSPQWAGLIARANGEAVGYATYVEGFHIWSGSARIALDDVYVRPAYRSRGLGEQLMRRVFQEAKAKNAIVTWAVQTANTGAIAFYKRLGAQYDVIGKCLWRADA